MKVQPHTVQWSLNPGYENHQWHSTIKIPGHPARPCKDPIKTALDALGKGVRRLCIKSARGTGKTYMGGRLITPWFTSVYPGQSRIFTFASREDQLKVGLWKEFEEVKGILRKDFPNSEWGVLQVFMNPADKNASQEEQDRARESWSIRGLTASIKKGEESSTKVSGIHDVNMLFILEELQGYDPAVVKSLRRTAQGENNIIVAYGNPKGETEELHQFSIHPSTVTITISAMDHPNIVCQNPNIIPGAVSQMFIDDLLNEPEINGDKTHPVYLAEVHGITPISTGNCMFHANVLKKIRETHSVFNENTGGWDWVMPDMWQMKNHEAWDGDVMLAEGYTWIKEEPKFTHFDRYMVAGDVSGANIHGDWDFGIVWDRVARKIVAICRMRCIGNQYSDELLRLANLFSPPDPRPGFDGKDPILLSYEVNGVGQLHRYDPIRNYERLYRRINIDDKNPSDKSLYGWATTRGDNGTRKAMERAGLAWGGELLHNPDSIWHEQLFEEMKAFCWNPQNQRYEAVSGFHDDGVMASLQALVIDEEQRTKGRGPVPFTEEQLAVVQGEVAKPEVQPRNKSVSSKTAAYSFRSAPRSFKRKY